MRLHDAPAPMRLLPLAAAVLALHLLALGWGPGLVAPAPQTGTPVFVTREIAPALPPAAVAAPPEPAPVQPRPKPRVQASPPVRQPAHETAAVAPAAPEPAAAPAASTASADPATPAPAAAPASGTPARATAIPQPARMHYEVELGMRGIQTRGKAELQWRHDGSQYEARMELSGTLVPVSRVQTSTGRITAEGLAPTRFADKRGKEEAAHFEREKGKVVFSNNKPEADLMAGAQDRLSVLMQLAALVGGAPANFPAGTAIAIQTADTRGAEPWTFTVEGEEELALPGGTRRTLKLLRMPRKEYDYKLELWLAPGMDYAPVRLRLTYPNGDWLDQRWASTDKG
jgi:hypothetical protein